MAKRHGVSPMDSTEPTYVAVKIFENKSKYEENQKDTVAGTTAGIGQLKAPDTVFYEGTLMLASPN